MRTWKDLLDEVEKFGFEIIKQKRFEYKVYKPEHLIAAHKEKSLLLCATSWIDSGGEHLNNCHIYGTITKLETVSDHDFLRTAIRGCSGSYKNKAFAFDFSTSDIFSDRLMEMERYGTFIKWNDPNRPLNVVDYVEDKKNGLWRLELEVFLSTAPDWVRNFIFPTPQ